MDLAVDRRCNRPCCYKAILNSWLLLSLLYISGLPAYGQVRNEQDLMLSHYRSAHAALDANNLVQADTEYKAFLGEAIHRIANARAHKGDMNTTDQNFKKALLFAT